MVAKPWIGFAGAVQLLRSSVGDSSFNLAAERLAVYELITVRLVWAEIRELSDNINWAALRERKRIGSYTRLAVGDF